MREYDHILILHEKPPKDQVLHISSLALDALSTIKSFTGTSSILTTTTTPAIYRQVPMMLFKGLSVSLMAAAVLGSPVAIDDNAALLAPRQQPDHPQACLPNDPIRITCRNRHIENCRNNEWVTVPCEPLYTAACQNHCYYDAPCIEGRICAGEQWKWWVEYWGVHDDLADVPSDCPVDGDAYKACYGPQLEWCRTIPRFSDPEHKDYVADPEFCLKWTETSCRRACHV